MEVHSVSFGAIPIRKAVIKKLNKSSGKFVDYPVNFVKLDRNNKTDLDALDMAAKKWKSATYIQQISTSAHWMNNKPIDVYILTSQQSNFDKLHFANILGLASMRKEENTPSEFLLRYLQVRPSAMNVNQKYKVNYKYVGTAILKSLKKIYNTISLQADNDKNIKNFYKHNGFIPDFEGSRHYWWSSNPIKRLKFRIEKLQRESGIWLFA